MATGICSLGTLAKRARRVVVSTVENPKPCSTIIPASLISQILTGGEGDENSAGRGRTDGISVMYNIHSGVFPLHEASTTFATTIPAAAQTSYHQYFPVIHKDAQIAREWN